MAATVVLNVVRIQWIDNRGSRDTTHG
jgi:hypothetical protein